MPNASRAREVASGQLPGVLSIGPPTPPIIFRRGGEAGPSLEDDVHASFGFSLELYDVLCEDLVWAVDLIVIVF